MTPVKHCDYPHDVYDALGPELIELVNQIAWETGVCPSNVLIEAARDGLTAIKPKWERRKAKPV